MSPCVNHRNELHLRKNYDNLAPRDGELFLLKNFLEPKEASLTLQCLLSKLQWEEETIMMFGKPLTVPRLVCWYGDSGTRYSYSGTVHNPIPWTPTLIDLKTRIESFSNHRFNSVLGNLYRTGQDSMGWHADKEKELGLNPFIASLSLGVRRLFKIRHNKSKQIVDLHLPHGSLLLMGGNLQHCWRHCLPKDRIAKGVRVNLTFRLIKMPVGK